MTCRLLLLTRRPSRVADLFEVDVPRPRTPTTLTDPQFVRLKARAVEVFQSAVRES